MASAALKGCARLTRECFRLDEKEADENKENLDVCKDKEGDAGKKRVEHEISEGNVATAAAAALASAATKAKVCRAQISTASGFRCCSGNAFKMTPLFAKAPMELVSASHAFLKCTFCAPRLQLYECYH